MKLMDLRNWFRAFFVMMLFVASCAAQQTTGSIKGKVRVESGAGAAGVAVIAREGEREITRVETNSKGDFTITGLAPGTYGLTFRRTGLSVGSIENVEVRVGKTRALNDRLVLTVDTGSIASVRGSVFDPDGRSVPGVRVEIARLAASGAAGKKIAERITTQSGEFAFRVATDKAKYRVTVKADGAEPVTGEIEVDGAAIYRLSLSLRPKTNQ